MLDMFHTKECYDIVKCGQSLIKYKLNSSILLVYNKKRHMTWKSHDITS